MKTIEYKFNSDISIYFTPLENGKAEYLIEIHDFGNLEMRKLKVTWSELETLFKTPKLAFNGFFN